jgi:diguanylate cyclase (GGDEF)-like protein
MKNPVLKELGEGLPRPQLSRYRAACGSATVVLGIALTAWLAVRLQENEAADLQLRTRANDHALILEDGIKDYIDKIAALRAFFYASDQVTRTEFASFSEAVQESQTGTLAFSWLPRVRQSQRIAHELAANRDGLSGYRIKWIDTQGVLVPAGPASEYFPVLYSSREPPNSPVYGLDLNDRGIRQVTLERARDSGSPATSAHFVLRSGEGNRDGFFIVLPVYRVGFPRTTVEDRRSNLTGFVQGVFQTGVLVETILKSTTTPAGLDFYLFDTDAEGGGEPNYFHASRARSSPIAAQSRALIEQGIHWSRTIEVGDRQWLFIAVPIVNGPGTANHAGSWLILIGGVCAAGCIFTYMLASGRNARRLGTARQERDNALDALNIANERLLEQNTLFETAQSNMSQALLLFDASGHLRMSNIRYCELYSLSPDVVKPGCTIRELIEHRRERGTFSGDSESYLQGLHTALAEGKRCERFTELPDGRTIAVVNHPMPGGAWVSTHEDITERRRAEARIAYLARHDPLTGLPNRSSFQEQLQAALSRAGRAEPVAVLCLDLDRFKCVNDTLGHGAGDKLLQITAERLRAAVRENDILARLGGDEFAVVEIGASQPAASRILATRLIETISAPCDLDGNQAVVGLSIGIALSPGDGGDSQELLKNADLALYRAKADGRGMYHFFEPEMDARMQARRALEVDLRKAIAAGEFELFYQPLVNIETQLVTGCEALLRWRHPQRGVISPMDFVPLAEETGLIVPIGEWVLRQACAEAAAWPPNVKIAINLSPVQFKSKNLVAIIVSALGVSGLHPGRLALEITESVLLDDGAQTLTILHQLRNLGIRISMDDFGTGYSSLSYLRKFPFDNIKIDRTFIRDMSDREDSLAIVRAVAAMGKSLSIVTTAEGVETQDQLERLKREGCVEAQGFLFSPPVPAANIRKLLNGPDFVVNAGFVARAVSGR